MTPRPLLVLLAAAGQWAGASSAAHAACSDRPGTPNNVKATPISSDRINLQWTNTATERVWWDISVTDGRGRNTPHSLTGVGRGDQGRGTPASHMFIGLQPNQKLCFRIKARTAAKTQGCVSKLWSGSVCATTPPR